MNYNIISTGSKGNAVVINDSILIDCGVPYKALKPAVKGLKLVLLTHRHVDHFQPSTVRTLHHERPTLRFGCCEWMVELLLEAGVDKRVIDVFDPTIQAFEMYGSFASIRAQEIPHNVPNCAYHVIVGGERLFYATDCGTLDGVEAKGYDLYMVEANHTKAEIEARIAEKQAAGEFAYEFAAAQNHLSREQAEDWLYRNMGANSKYLFLHQHVVKERENNNAQ